MKPLKLTMQAFGSYGKKTSIDFEKPNQNLFLITGDTGAGKTTIFDAIVFALYGEASSVTNKKSGIVLQSQFTGFDVEPFVELTFSEKSGEDDNIYTVKRIPRHLKTLTRGASKGIAERETNASVTLIMPDGTEYPQKEVDKKIEELIGLTKNQFMQVAMIAQGEFTELLRADSDNKKTIFRRLFNTELYQNIVEELNNRRRAKEKEIAIIRTQCQTVAGRVAVPDEYERMEELNALKKRVENGELVVMGQFLEELKSLCEQLKEEVANAEKNYNATSKVRDEKRDLHTNAKNLLKFFEQLDKAQNDIEECRSKESKIKDVITLISKLRTAYEIETEYQRYKEAEKLVTDTQTAYMQQQDALPALIDAAKETAEKEAMLKDIYEKELARYSQVSEKVDKALTLFAKIDTEKKAVEKRSRDLQAAEKNAETAQKNSEELEAREKDWKNQLESLGDAEKQLALWEGDSKEAASLTEEVDELIKSQEEIEQQKSKAEKSKQDYKTISEQYQIKSNEYESKRQAFLDAQAGFLAKKLEAGKPCPVCGSLEHPNPCQWEGESAELTEEVIESLGSEVEQLRSKQEQLAAEAKSNADLLAEKETTLREESGKLYQRMKKGISDLPEEFNLQEAQELILNWSKSVKLRGEELTKNVRKLNEIQDLLRNVDEKRSKLRLLADEAKESAVEAKTALESSKATLQSLETSKDYQTEEDAKTALTQAEQEKNKQELEYNTASEIAVTAKKKKDNAEALIQKYTEEIPKYEEQHTQRKASYEAMMQKGKLSESEWKTLTEEYEKSQTDILQNEVNNHNSKLAAAEELKKNAAKAIGEQKRPVIEDIKKEFEEAEDKLKIAKQNYEELKEYYKSNSEVYNDLSPRMDVRRKIVGEHAKLDTLYRLAAGNVTGARMDLETYVQRYYLEKILYAANRRFQDMSAGQFELRMVDLDKAGEGKNRGLDLMVYSTVTGKEREIRTLSGGESFMAALALALGMADQIQENSAAINLDIMFIDEGFGSLDEHSRNQAVKVLLEMAEGEKMIGIISHVTELKQEIEDQLVVGKDENGSFVRWEIS
ncbi:MAG: SMC family ATPase [Lachnospiraceae bacterium]|nr:SMC family ATPase [Lachnospiraceae bacterium]